MSDICDREDKEASVNKVVPKYYRHYEEIFGLPVYRPIHVQKVSERDKRFIIETNGPRFSSRGLINATGTWQTPRMPKYPGSEKFQRQQLHTKDYTKAEDFKG